MYTALETFDEMWQIGRARRWIDDGGRSTDGIGTAQPSKGLD